MRELIASPNRNIAAYKPAFRGSTKDEGRRTNQKGSALLRPSSFVLRTSPSRGQRARPRRAVGSGAGRGLHQSSGTHDSTAFTSPARDRTVISSGVGSSWPRRGRNSGIARRQTYSTSS